MSATDPIHQEVTYNNGDWSVSGYEDRSIEDLNKLLKSASFPYQWGVYTTAYARLQLQQAIDYVGDKIVYCDTDSIKTIGSVDIEKLNDTYLHNAINHQAFADDMKGKRHYCGLFEKDGYYDKFITQGSKRYAYIHYHNEFCKSCDRSELCCMGITVAGVSKKTNEDSGFPFACEELQTLERFKIGMIWSRAGGTTAVYNDDDNFDYTDPITGNSIHISKNVAIVPSTYEMGYSKDYALLLDEIQLYGDYRRSIE